MSILSTFALVTAAVVAKLRSNPDVEATKRIAELESQVENLQARLDASLDDAHRQYEETMRWQALAASWQARYEAIAIIEQRSQQQQYAAMQNQAMMNAQPYNQGLAQQNMLQQWEHFCTCIPDRATALGVNRRG